MKKTVLIALPLSALLYCAPVLAAKQDETEGTGKMPQQAGAIYDKTDKKAAQRPGQTIHAQPIAPIKGQKGEDKTTKGEETAGTAAATRPKGDTSK
ncbi:MAG: hypothetical protein Q8O52_26950 [Sulfuritalea sp.]|nr:hypothetical protein [Sulfuritalea sp.]